MQRVLDKMGKIPLHVSPYPTGLDEKIKDLERTILLQHQRDGARVVGITGLGGIGKMTLAKEFFNLHRSDYHRSCFLFDVREKVATRFLNKLQMKLLRELTKLNNEEIDNTHEGKVMLTMYLSSSHESLIVLDDVDHIEHLDALLLPIKDVFHSGSLILVTSQNKDVLISLVIPASSIYRLTGLNLQQSQELFCSHAFH